MLLSLKWLQKYIPDFQINNLDSFRYKVDTRLSEVKSVEVKGLGLEKLFTAQILEVEAHPKSEKLHVCKVTMDGKEQIQIVCGAPNVRPGLVSVLCLPGGKVYAPGHAESGVLEIGVRAVAGVDSNGMLCSTAELGLNDHHDSIIELPSSTPLGEDVTDQFLDTVIYIENKAFPHRPDVFSHAGIAREFAAIFSNEYKGVEKTAEFIAKAENTLPLEVEIKASEGCQRFSAVTLSDLKVGPSPLWLQILLNYCGVRAINNVVDVTNYMMLDMGQPMHAFDYSKVAEHKLTVRMARAEEELTTLDGKERKLSKEMLVIADGKAAQSIAGIMGGASTEIANDTQAIILEAANWEMYRIRRTSRELGLRSEASTRYEKGMSPEYTAIAVVKAANMLLDLAGAEVAGELIDIYPEAAEAKLIPFELNSVAHLLGVQIDKQQLIDILENLELEPQNPEQIPADALARADMHTELMIKVPAHRRDINIGADILEEIGRYYGYENFPLTLPKRDLFPAEVNKHFHAKLELKHLMAASGLHEIFTYSMIGAELLAKSLLTPKGLLKVVNPISPELAFVRNTLIPSILEKVKVNQNKFGTFGLFEISQVAIPQGGKLPEQPAILSGAYISEDGETAYRHLKQAIVSLQQKYPGKIALEATKNAPAYMHPSKCGQVTFGGKPIGFIGVLHPKAGDNFEFGNNGVAVFEINLSEILNFVPEVRQFRPLAKVPAVVRDISFWADKGFSMQELSTKLSGANIPDLESSAVLSTYTKDAKRSYTVRFTFQPYDKTLTQDEINSRVEAINNALKSSGYELR
ncbi:MAG: phenylalanine--tRNA ligase subunit beta [Candidatus Doudnabacteria bacterium]|nr:phenylalanine--tRNA ligase subunit beta [Candidatus Doudnabacteria bacterium]